VCNEYKLKVEWVSSKLDPDWPVLEISYLRREICYRHETFSKGKLAIT
jgi:hypothetical protein